MRRNHQNNGAHVDFKPDRLGPIVKSPYELKKIEREQSQAKMSLITAKFAHEYEPHRRWNPSHRTGHKIDAQTIEAGHKRPQLRIPTPNKRPPAIETQNPLSSAPPEVLHVLPKFPLNNELINQEYRNQELAKEIGHSNYTHY